MDHEYKFGDVIWIKNLFEERGFSGCYNYDRGVISKLWDNGNYGVDLDRGTKCMCFNPEEIEKLPNGVWR